MNNLKFVSAFLSHSSADKELVEQVALCLGRRGVLAWLDQSELLAGSLDIALKEAVQKQTVLVIFLSEKLLASDWCLDELRWAIEARAGTDHLIPIYLGDPLALVKQHPLLRQRFLHPDGDRVNQLGYPYTAEAAQPDPEEVAKFIAAAVYPHVIPQNWSDIAIVLDQRGKGPRRGKPQLPENMQSFNIPVLTFRPSLAPRQDKELLQDKDWANMADAVKDALSTALGTVRGEPRKVRVFGHSQTGFFWLVGKLIDRTTSADLYGYDRYDVSVTNKSQQRYTPLTGGVYCAEQLSGTLTGLQTVLALGIGVKANYPSTIRKALPNDMPLFWIETAEIQDSDQAMELVKNIVASVSHLRNNHNVQEIQLYWTSANHVALLAAANLTTHVMPVVRFMEWDHSNHCHVQLPMP